MKINGTIFSKPQQDQLKRAIGAELDKVVAKVDDVDARMLNYMGDWATGNEYHENDVVTWAQDGHLYEVIKAHTSSSIIDPSRTEYYKAMTAVKYISKTYALNTQGGREGIINDIREALNSGKRAQSELIHGSGKIYIDWCSENNLNGGTIIGSCIVETNDKLRIYTLSININDRLGFYYDINTSGSITRNALNLGDLVNVTVFFES